MMDRERADFGEAVDALKARFGDEVVAVALPIGEEAGFKGVVDLLAMKAYTYSGGAGKGAERPIPDDLQDAADEAREKLVDRVAEADDALLEKYLEGERAHRSEEIIDALQGGRGRRHPSARSFPSAATKNIGYRPAAAAPARPCPRRLARGAAQGPQGARRPKRWSWPPRRRRPPRSSSSRPSTTSSRAA